MKPKHGDSWIIRNRKTGAVVLETWNPDVVALLTEKYEAVTPLQHLTELNALIKSGRAKNPAPRRGPAKPKRASQRAHVTKSGIESKTPTKRLVKRRTANTKKGYFPNPKERMFNVWHTDGTVTPVPLIARFSFYVAGKIRYWFALHDSPGQYNMYAVSEWESGVAVVTYSKSARIAYALSSRSLKTDSQLSTAKQELENRLAPVSLEKFQSAVKKAIENHGAIN